jgi:hypothetical protein
MAAYIEVSVINDVRLSIDFRYDFIRKRSEAMQISPSTFLSAPQLCMFLTS